MKVKKKSLKTKLLTVEDDKNEFEIENISASEDEGDQERKHAKMLDAIGALDGKRRRKHRTEPSKTISEFNLAEVGREKIKLYELVASLKETSNHTVLKKQLNATVKRKKILPVPLHPEEAEKVKRNVGYEKVCKEVSQWDSIIEANRQAEQLVFPLKRPDISIRPASEFVKKFQPKTPLEIEISNVLNSSDNVLTKDSILTPAEKKALKAMSLEEARERHRELQKSRALLSYAEAKARRQNKIKSKRYHRILKRERLRMEMKEFETLRETNPDLAEEKLKELDKQRILERMTLKHRNTGKWAKHKMLRAKYDKHSRDAITQQLQLNYELIQKINIPIEDNKDDETEDNDHGKDVMEPLEGNSCCSPTDNSALSRQNYKNSIEPETQKVEVELPFSNKQEDINHIFNKFENSRPKRKSMQKIQNDSHARNRRKRIPPENEEQQLIVETLERKQTMEDFDNVEETEHEEESLNCTKSKSEEQSRQDTTHDSTEKAKKYNLPLVPTISVKDLQSQVPELVTFGEEELDDIYNDEEPKLNLEDAYNDDEIYKEFRAEKEAVIQKEKPEDLNTYLPGWGSWGGTSIRISKRKNRRFMIKAPPAPPRKDNTLSNVIINENQNAKLREHQVSEVPFPFTSVHQFESSIRQPIGNMWNPETAFRRLIAPKVVTQLGKIIEPIDSDALLKKPRKLEAEDEQNEFTKKSNKKAPFKQKEQNKQSTIRKGKKGNNM